MKRFTKIMALLAVMTVALAFAGCENFIMGDSTDTEKENPDYTENEKKSDGDSENSDKGGGDSSTTEGEHSDPNDTDDDASVTEWMYFEDGFSSKLIFYSDGTFKEEEVYYDDGDTGENHGTYSGDTTKVGTIYGKMADDTGGYKDIKGEIISDKEMKFYYSLYDEDPLLFTRVK